MRISEIMNLLDDILINDYWKKEEEVALIEAIAILDNVKKMAEGEQARKELLCTVGSSEEKTI